MHLYDSIYAKNYPERLQEYIDKLTGYYRYFEPNLNDSKSTDIYILIDNRISNCLSNALDMRFSKCGDNYYHFYIMYHANEPLHGDDAHKYNVSLLSRDIKQWLPNIKVTSQK